MPDTLTRLADALHAELCRQHDVQPEGHSLTGDYAALGDDAAKLAEIAQPYLDAAWEAGRKHGLRQARKPHDGRVKQLEEEIEGALALEEATGRAWALQCLRVRDLEEQVRDLEAEVERLQLEAKGADCARELAQQREQDARWLLDRATEFVVHGPRGPVVVRCGEFSNWTTASHQSGREEHPDRAAALARAREIAGE